MRTPSFLGAAAAVLFSVNINAQSPASGTINGHDYVDLGLSVKWATCNIGASSPSDYGDYYAWGEAETKSEYTKENSTTYGKDNFTFHDAAAEKWGGTWRMPTVYEFWELLDRCDVEQVTIDDRNLIKFTSNKNGNYIYLPCAGIYEETKKEREGIMMYWTSEFRDSYTTSGFGLEIIDARYNTYAWHIYVGLPIRPVSDGTPASATAEITTINGYQYVDLGLSVRWGTCNVGASLPSEEGRCYAWGYTYGEYEPYNDSAADKESSMFIIDYSGDKHFDAATVRWGSKWRIPTSGEWDELCRECEGALVIQDGIKGYKFTSKKNGNSIFLPLEVIDEDKNKCSTYWSSSIYEGDCYSESSLGGSLFMFNGETWFGTVEIDRWRGESIRPVTNANDADLGHDYVDLGLSVKWATCNIGAETPSDYGDRFAWGETETKQEYTKQNSRYYKREKTDNRMSHTLSAEHDAASTNWGGSWRMPTEAEFQELIDNCTWEFTILGEREGYKVTSKKNGKNIFLPATMRFGTNNCGVYWSSTAGLRLLSTPDGHLDVEPTTTYGGQPVRPVLEPKGKKNGHKYVDLGLSVMWATCNVGADKPEDYGGYFAWGETETKSKYEIENYTYHECYTINKSNDAAYDDRGATWRMPTIAEWKELEENCDWKVVKIRDNWDEHICFKFTSRINGNSILLHAKDISERPWGTQKYICEYWSSSNDPNDIDLAQSFFLNCQVSEDGVESGTIGNESVSRFLYKNIRPVTE